MSRCVLLGLGLVFIASEVFAQGLIWKAPPAGTEVQYEGDYIQEDERPQEVDRRIELKWRRRLTIKALKKVQAEYNGQMVDSQWFEFKVVTASEVGGDGALVPGPGGQRIYKILVPLEHAAFTPSEGKVVDQEGIPIAYVPIVKGYRRIDEQAAQPITSGVFDAHPMVTLLANYRTLERVAENEDPDVTLEGADSAIHYHGELVMESPTNRTTNKAEIWASDSVPFGLARWQVEVVREIKHDQAARDQYQVSSTYRVDMKAVRQSSDAVSDLPEE